MVSSPALALPPLGADVRPPRGGALWDAWTAYRRGVVPWRWLLAGWTAFSGFDFAIQWVLYGISPNRPPSGFMAGTLAAMLSFDTLLWVCIAQLVLVAADRRPVRRGSPARLPGWAALVAAVALLPTVEVATVGRLIGFVEGDPAFLRLLTWRFHVDVLLALVLAVAGHALAYHRHARRRAMRTAALEAQLALARAEALKAQLEPHFLFNALNSISELVHEDAAGAERMIGSLKELLRMTLEGAEAQEVTLAEELRLLGAYLRIQQTRFQDRLSVEVDAAPETLAARVPPLVLQPLVENAIRHGIAPRPGPGRISVRAWREGDALRLEVRDDGLGFSERSPPEEGVGLGNTRARLHRLYGDAQRFELASGEDGGAVAHVAVPFRTDAADS